MMKKLVILFVAFLAVSNIEAQQTGIPEIRERIYLQTDKDYYLSGELIWMKLITTTETGLPMSFSKVGYVEVLDEKESRVQAKIDLSEGSGSGTVLLPASLPTGYYRLVGYTRYMRNEGPAVFFEKWIGIVNPVTAEVLRGSSTVPPPSSTRESNSSPTLTLSTDRAVYSPRSEVRLELSGIPEDIHTLSLSATSRDLTGQFPLPGLNEWKNNIPENAPTAPVSGDYPAEYEGQIITGKLVDTETNEPTYLSHILPLAAFSGDEINLFGGKLDESGGVTYYTSRTTGFNEIVTTMRGNNNASYRIDIDSPYSPEKSFKQAPTLPLGEINNDMLLQQSLAMQLQYSYVNDSLSRFAKVSPHFFYRPDYSYVLQEWTRFATMQEVVTEFVTAVRFRRTDNRRYLSVVNEDYGFSQTNSLVLLDGIPVIDHELIYNYNPLLLSRIDVFFDRFIMGDHRFDGIVALYTEQYNYPEFRPDPFTQIVPYDSPQAHRLFYAPDYSDNTRKSSRLPDFRHTLYWKAEIKPDETGKAVLSFSTSDLTGSYQIVVEGMTRTGEIIQATHPIEVR